MIGVFKSQRKHKLKKLESMLFDLVEKKERQQQTMDEQGRDLVMGLRDSLDSNTISQRKLISEAKRYLRENQHYY